MRTFFAALSLAALLVACVPATQPNTTETSASSAARMAQPLTITFSEETQNKGATTLSIYSLTLAGAVNETVRLGSMEVDGEVPMHLVPAGAYKNTKVQQGFETYYAGGGMQVAVFRSGDMLSIKKRETSEESESPASACGAWQTIATYTVPSVTTIAWKNLPTQEANQVISCAW